MDREEEIKKELVNNLIYYLENNTISNLFSLVELAIEEKKDLSKDITDIDINPFYTTDSKLGEMESNCNVLSNLIGKNDLNHRERMILLFIYCKLGDVGVQRLKQIMTLQKNYKKHITEKTISEYLKKEKLLGISCEKIQEWIGKNLCKGCSENV